MTGAALIAGYVLLGNCEGKPADYSDVNAILTEHCLDCHAAKDPEGQLVLENFETLMKGGETGPAIVASNSVESLLVRMIEGHVEKNGKPKIMPPGKRKKLTGEQIATIKSWVDGGAKAPAMASRRELVVPRIQPRGSPRNPINALAYSAPTKLLAVARYGSVELLPDDAGPTRTLGGHLGNVNAIVFANHDGELFAAGGQPGVAGEVRHWRVGSGELIRAWEGHQDAIYGMALSPNGKVLATGSYDQKIKLWNLETGQEAKTLSGHNGCVYDLAFRPDGKILASASADRTVKLWDVESGERRDTLSQSSKELFSVAFSPNGRRLVAGGADNRIRVWQVSDAAAETSNPMLHSIFAHEGAILNLVFSPDGTLMLSAADDRSVKLWDAATMKERLLLESQPDWPAALAFMQDKMLAVGRLDGTLSRYNLATGKPITAIEAKGTSTVVRAVSEPKP